MLGVPINMYLSHQVMTSSLMLGVPISDAIDQPQVHTDVINDGEVKVELQLSQVW